jgi:xanthine dehydrogenase YagS FAD-binding subunit
MKLRDRSSYEFALVSVFAAAYVDGGLIRDVRLALGGVGTKPWRARRAEEVLLDGPATPRAFREAAEAELAAAVPREHNAFKVELTARAIVRALDQAVAGGAV